MGYRTKALVLALFCLLAVSTLLTTSANVVAKEEGQEEEEAHVAVDAKKGLRKVLNEKTVESVGKAANNQDIPPNMEDEKYYGRRGYGYGYGRRGYGYGRGRYGYGRRGYGHGRGRYGYGRGRYGRGRYGRGRYRHGYCHHC